MFDRCAQCSEQYRLHLRTNDEWRRHNWKLDKEVVTGNTDDPNNKERYWHLFGSDIKNLKSPAIAAMATSEMTNQESDAVPGHNDEGFHLCSEFN